MRKSFLKTVFIYLCVFVFTSAKANQPAEREDAGVYKYKAGVEDAHTPLSFKMPAMSQQLKMLPVCDNPFNDGELKITVTSRGCIVEIPLADGENIYGFGLQMGSFRQNNMKRKPLVNDYPLNNLGYSHAPLPFYISSRGYAVLINTARYPTFYIGGNRKNLGAKPDIPQNQKTRLSTEELYNQEEKTDDGAKVTVDIPGAKGISVFIFAGPEMKTALQRYNLFSGGGSFPAMWGLGVKYRVKADSHQDDVYRIAEYFRSKNIPCDVIGLEPDWQTRAYSCSYVWNNKLFSDPKMLISKLGNSGYKINLWEHAFVNPESPLYEPLKDKSGDYLVWNGLVPDFVSKEVRNIFGSYHSKTFIEEDISGFKLDECDNSDIGSGGLNWSFPELSRFPSGVDGEQMHQLFGVLYQKTICDEYAKYNKRTYIDVRASGPFASVYPASLYSDTYDLPQYLQMVSNSSLSGLLWSPEIRESGSRNDFFRRSQLAVLSAQTLYNCWYLKNPPWLQFDRSLNNNDDLLPDGLENERIVKKLLDFRMSLIPYLYNAFAEYRFTGIPPFKPMVLNYTNDKNVADIWDQFLIGDDILACPITGNGDKKKIYLPEGTWYNFNTNEKYSGGAHYEVVFKIDEIPVFVREGTILPLAKPVSYVGSETVFDIVCHLYGENLRAAALFEDDGVLNNYEHQQYNKVELSWSKNGKGKIKRTGNYKKVRYRIIDWKVIK
ncbi:MAG: glycoside hydrolase family 31 protein [Niabella sp.]